MGAATVHADSVSVQLKTHLFSIRLRARDPKAEIQDATADNSHTSYLKRKEKQVIVLRKSDRALL